MEHINHKKLYLLLELEKIKQNQNSIHNIFVFPVGFFKFDVIVLESNKKYSFSLTKETVCGEWRLVNKDWNNLVGFDSNGEYCFKDTEAIKVLVDFKNNFSFPPTRVLELPDSISNNNREIIKLMERFNTGDKNKENDFLNKLDVIERKMKEKNNNLMGEFFK